MNFGIIVLICMSWFDGSRADSYLWDLDADPYETVNLYGDSTYSTVQTLMSDYLTSAFSESIYCDTDDELVLSLEIDELSDCGGVCAYANNTYSLEIEQIYSADTPPHIVFMLADDWGYNDFGGYMDWTTPVITSLVKEGVTLTNYFTHFYCMPSRGALLTGRTANRLGMMEENGFWCQLPLSEVTIGQEMQSAGYRTYLVGKWHMGYIHTYMYIYIYIVHLLLCINDLYSFKLLIYFR